MTARGIMRAAARPVIGLALIAALVVLAAPARTQGPPPLPAAVVFVTSGGHWQDGGHRGHYRLIVLRQDTSSTAPRLVIEWIQEDGGHEVVRESRGAAVLADPWTLEEPEFLPGAGGGRRTSATVFGSDPSGQRGHWTITLGPPGVFSVSPTGR